MTELSVRRAGAADIPAVREILWTTWLDTYGPFIPRQDLESFFVEHYSEGELRGLLDHEDARVYLASMEEKPAATLITRRHRNERRFYVSSLYVTPSRQGRGIGARLLREAEREARVEGFDAIWLAVMAQNVKTVAWYERLGFRFDQREIFTMGSTRVEHLIGWKSAPPLP